MTTTWIERLGATDEGRRLLEQERLIVEVTEAVATLMSKQDVSRSVLARRIGKSPAFVTKLLRGNNNFTLRTLSDVFSSLGKSMHVTVGELGDGICSIQQSTKKSLNLSSAYRPRPRPQWEKEFGALKLTNHCNGEIAA